MTGDFQWGVSIPAPDISEAGEFFAALSDHMYAELTGQGIDAHIAAKAIHATLARLSETFAGEKLYVNKNPATFARWMQAYNDLRTMPYRDVDRKYGWSAGYSLIVKQRIQEMMLRRHQLRLPIDG